MSAGKVSRSEASDGADNDQSTTHPGRKKADGGGVRTWFRLTATGRSRLLDMGKQAIKCRTGLSTRDYRILDPLLAYPATILGHRRAVVVNLGHIRGIITTRDVWLLNYKDPAVAPFIKELKWQVMKYNGGEATENDPAAAEANPGNLHNHSQELKSTASSQRQVVPVVDLRQEVIQGQEEQQEVDRVIKTKTDEKQRPSRFEFMVLEACLKNVCASFDLEVKTLELEAYPTLDELNVKISKFTLDCVRQIKGRVVLLNNCIQKIKEEIDHILGKDELMADMYLTSYSQPEGSHDVRSATTDDEDDEVEEPDNRYEEDSSPRDEIHEVGTALVDGASNSKRQVMELERILETYLIRFDATLNKVSSLKEQIHGMESYLTLVLDDKQNGLLQLIIHLKTGNAVLQVYSLFVAFLAANITISIFNGNSNDTLMWWINGAWTALTILGHVFLISLYKYKGWFI